MIEFIGWIASNLFAFCALPQCIKVVKQGHARGLDKTFTFMWLTGEVLMQIYVINKHGFDIPLLWNYWANTTFVLIIVYYMFFPKDKSL